MKIRLDIDSQLWSKFRAKVHHEHLALDEVVTKVVEPALQAYLEPEKPPRIEVIGVTPEEAQQLDQELPILDRITPLKQAPPPTATRRCELCDNPSERLYALNAYRVCYTCWKNGLMAPEPTPPAAA